MEEIIQKQLLQNKLGLKAHATHSSKLITVAILVFGIILLFTFYYVSQVNFHRFNKSYISVTTNKNTGEENTTKAFTPVLYENTTDNSSSGKTSLELLSRLHATFIFRGTFQWGEGLSN